MAIISVGNLDDNARLQRRVWFAFSSQLCLRDGHVLRRLWRVYVSVLAFFLQTNTATLFSLNNKIESFFCLLFFKKNRTHELVGSEVDESCVLHFARTVRPERMYPHRPAGPRSMRARPGTQNTVPGSGRILAKKESYRVRSYRTFFFRVRSYCIELAYYLCVAYGRRQPLRHRRRRPYIRVSTYVRAWTAVFRRA
jgi:hypothetical protein